MAADVNEVPGVSRRAFLHGMVATGVALHARDAAAQEQVDSTNDPLLRGPVAAPPGALANDPNGISPQETPLAARPI